MYSECPLAADMYPSAVEMFFEFDNILHDLELKPKSEWTIDDYNENIRCISQIYEILDMHNVPEADMYKDRITVAKQQRDDYALTDKGISEIKANADAQMKRLRIAQKQAKKHYRAWDRRQKLFRIKRKVRNFFKKLFLPITSYIEMRKCIRL